MWILKFLIQRERPFKTLSYILKLSEGGGYSFPSGHTTEAFAVAFALIFFTSDKYISYLVLIWAMLVAYSRIVLGVHFPSDILVAIMIALFTTLSTKFLFNKCLRTKKT
jgi:undecaprenyl-diphosphatase